MEWPLGKENSISLRRRPEDRTSSYRDHGRLSLLAICCGVIVFASSRSRDDCGNCNAIVDHVQRTSDKKYSSPYLLKISFAPFSGCRTARIAKVVRVCPAPSDR